MFASLATLNVGICLWESFFWLQTLALCAYSILKENLWWARYWQLRGSIKEHQDHYRASLLSSLIRIPMDLLNRSKNTLHGLILRPRKLPPNDYYYQPFAKSITFEPSVECKTSTWSQTCSEVDSKGQLSTLQVLKVQGLYSVSPKYCWHAELGYSDKTTDKFTVSETFMQQYLSSCCFKLGDFFFCGIQMEKFWRNYKSFSHEIIINADWSF